MNALPLSLADADVEEVLEAWRFTDPSTREGIAMLGAIGLIILLVLVWAIFLRKRGRRRRLRHHAHHHSSNAPEGSPAPNGDELFSSRHKRRKLRRHQRRHHPRNPTLAETGGLPPVRPEGPVGPQP
jgi:hypothetical protein